MAYLAQLRAEHAAVLLLHSDEPVTSIGRAVGWPDQSGFARRFKAHYGLSATTYRKRFATGTAHLHQPARSVPILPSNLTYPLADTVHRRRKLRLTALYSLNRVPCRRDHRMILSDHEVPTRHPYAWSSEASHPCTMR